MEARRDLHRCRRVVTRGGSERLTYLPPLCKRAPKAVRKLSRDKIEVRSYVGWLVQSFERKAAYARRIADAATLGFQANATITIIDNDPPINATMLNAIDIHFGGNTDSAAQQSLLP